MKKNLRLFVFLLFIFNTPSGSALATEPEKSSFFRSFLTSFLGATSERANPTTQPPGQRPISDMEKEETQAISDQVTSSLFQRLSFSSEEIEKIEHRILELNRQYKTLITKCKAADSPQLPPKKTLTSFFLGNSHGKQFDATWKDDVYCDHENDRLHLEYKTIRLGEIKIGTINLGIAFEKNSKGVIRIWPELVKKGINPLDDNASFISKLIFKNHFILDGESSVPGVVESTKLHGAVDAGNSETYSALFYPWYDQGNFQTGEAARKQQELLSIGSDEVYIKYIANTFKDVARGLLTIHDAGVVHRDLSPENVLLESSTSDRTRAAITGFDYAVSTHIDELNPHPSLVGNPMYTAPECWPNKEKEARKEKMQDIYAFGIMILQKLPEFPILTCEGQGPECSYAHIYCQSHEEKADCHNIKASAQFLFRKVAEDQEDACKTSKESDHCKLTTAAMESLNLNPEKRPTAKRLTELLGKSSYDHGIRHSSTLER